MPKELSLYSPVLRLKLGEVQGLYHLSNEMKALIRPQLIIPPTKERDDSNFELFDKLTGQQNLGRSLAPFWRGRSALLNPKHIYKEYGEESAASWLPKLFDGAREAGINAVPVATLLDLEGPRALGLASAIDRSNHLHTAITIKADDLLDSSLRSRLDSAITMLRVDETHCSVQIDFEDANFESTVNASEIIEAAYEDLQAIGNWESIVFQGTSFPKANPAGHKAIVRVMRTEWAAWKKAMSLSSSTPHRFMFGDYAADNSKMHFGKGRAAAIRHYRYTTSDFWLVVRGSETGKDKTRMQWIAKQIVDSGCFDGGNFSQADQYIFETAKGNAGPGTPTTWRQVNTTRHITRVVHDIARERGQPIKIPTKTEEPSQLSFLES